MTLAEQADQESKEDCVERVEYGLLVGKRKGRQRDTAFTIFGNAEFRSKFYDRRTTFDAAFRIRVECEAKTRGIRNVQKRGS